MKTQGYKVNLGAPTDKVVEADKLKLVTISMRESEYLKLKAKAHQERTALSKLLVSTTLKTK